METSYIVSTVTESDLKSIRHAIHTLYQQNSLPVPHDEALTLCKQLDRQYNTANVLFFNQYEVQQLWKPLYNTIKHNPTLNTTLKKHLSEIHIQLTSFTPIELESDLFDLPQKPSE